MPNIKFVQIYKDDTDLYDKLLPLWIHYFDNVNWGEDEKPTHEESIENLNRRINIQGSRPDMHFEIVFCDDIPIGLINYAIDLGTLYGQFEPGYGCIAEFYIIPEFRRKGYGKLLCQHIEKTLKNHGAKRIYASPNHGIAEIFWRAMGYEDHGNVDPDNNQSVYVKSVD